MLKKLRVAVVDDSTFIRKALTRMLGDHPLVEVVGSADSGEELMTHFDRWDPDVVTLDLNMPGMGGLLTLDAIRAKRTKTPVIILSTHSGKGAPQTIEALHRGATDFIDKQNYSLVDFGALREILIEKIFQVTGAHPEGEEAPIDPRFDSTLIAPSVFDQEDYVAPGAYDLVVIGASTGGPPTIQEILEELGPSCPVPILIVQHMPVGFTQAFAERLNAHLPLHVREATAAEPLLPDTVYMATAGIHMRVRRSRGDSQIYSEFSPHPAELVHTPAIDILFESAAKSVGKRTIGVLLTGMGADGALGLLDIKNRHGYTLVQDEETSIVYGMPRAAIHRHAHTEIATPKEIGQRIHHLIQP